ncbi:hypothetical protein A2U01_0066367, partial [Trifolium medium]|nr:hypothetical protein [Trifolium medium]
GTSSSMNPGVSSDRASPAPSIEIVPEKRPREADLVDSHTSRKGRRTSKILTTP